MVALEVTTFSAAYMISHSYETATSFAAAVAFTVAFAFALAAVAVAFAAVAVAFAAVAFAFAVFAAATFVAAFAVFAVFTFAAAVFTVVEKENLSLRRVLMVLAGEAGAIIGWMLLFPNSLPGAVLAVVAGVGAMVLAAFVGVRKPENATVAG
ncbi:MAG: hypothetical protein HYT38_02080 [Candidatus Sungbacteria bacterium]|uniref:Uncharacterized protein n=1 Tax=Candidatus Sungiibacteriota bacterium TaxID=2750080 RepID=A0A932DS75_9BACT|nr:hypothetical protein [Candidatus Sungbacteria bacterium]MBI2465976.1 hypothetical protein [Candidatus Sungbacteria bacterium]